MYPFSVLELLDQSESNGNAFPTDKTAQQLFGGVVFTL
jgi:hypothetical protein